MSDILLFYLYTSNIVHFIAEMKGGREVKKGTSIQIHLMPEAASSVMT
jgi:hypothetical protein